MEQKPVCSAISVTVLSPEPEEGWQAIHALLTLTVHDWFEVMVNVCDAGLLAANDRLVVLTFSVGVGVGVLAAASCLTVMVCVSSPARTVMMLVLVLAGGDIDAGVARSFRG